MTQTFAERPDIEVVHLIVRIGGVTHAIPITAVEEVLPDLPVEKIAQLPSFVRGVVFVRGHLIPVLDGAERLGLRSESEPQRSQLVCLRNGERLLGLKVDEAVDLMELPLQGRIPVPELGGESQFFSAVMDHQGDVMRILDPKKLLLADEASRLVQVAQEPLSA